LPPAAKAIAIPGTRDDGEERRRNMLAQGTYEQRARISAASRSRPGLRSGKAKGQR
jgi:hypothetical protein